MIVWVVVGIVRWAMLGAKGGSQWSVSPPPSPPAPLPKGEGAFQESVAGHIALRGVRVHNLRSIDLDIPHRKLIVLCGLSGSGKSSLALDTLYAEGQRRYIESFSAYTRQFLQRLEKPEAERIDGIPPAIAVTSKNTSRSSRSTVGTATETSDYLRLLFAKIGHVFCLKCGREVRRDSPQNAAESLGPVALGHPVHDRLPLRVARRRHAGATGRRAARRRVRAGDCGWEVGEFGCEARDGMRQRKKRTRLISRDIRKRKHIGGRILSYGFRSPRSRERSRRVPRVSPPSPPTPLHLRHRRSAHSRQCQRQPAPRFAGNGIHQGARAMLCVCGRGRQGSGVRGQKSRNLEIGEVRQSPIPTPSSLSPLLSPLAPRSDRRSAVAADGV